MTIHARTRSRKPREGAAMLVVMLLLLIVTATATFAIQTTTTEIRASGYQRQHMQTRHLAEGALVSGVAMIEQQDPASLRVSLERSTGSALRSGSGPARQLAPEEPLMDANVGNHRIELSQFLGAGDVVTQPAGYAAGIESFGPGMGYRPDFAIDVNDEYVFSGIVAGHRSDGQGQLEYISATYTARGRAAATVDRVSRHAPADLGGTGQGVWMRRGYHATVANARAIGISGPTARRSGS